MTRPAACLIIALAASTAVPLPAFAQQQSGTFTLPQPTPTQGPAPAGPADERAGVVIPPRAVPTAVPQPRPTASPRAIPTPILQPTPSPSPRLTPSPTPSARAVPLVRQPIPNDPVTPQPEPAPPPLAGETPTPAVTAAPPEPLTTVPAPPPAATAEPTADTATAAWWPWAVGGLAVLALIGGVIAWRRQRPPKALRLAAPVAATHSPVPDSAAPRVDITLDITAASRSVMMFTVQYRLTLANRSERAISDVAIALELACARTGAAPAGGNAASPGRAPSVASVERIGPHQARSITGQVQLPLSAIQPLRQGATPLFIPLMHVTLEGEGLPALSKSFVIGTPSGSGSGRVHPIALDRPPGGIAGLVAQGIAVPRVSAST
ncbi:hypothetical protein [Erythrobacter sp. R86502]|uniref:hypothetical protein n=1 Tax=Erythrobacter sp. R86502 TaxID=3093846 RepID=UPI0036D3D2C4